MEFETFLNRLRLLARYRFAQSLEEAGQTDQCGGEVRGSIHTTFDRTKLVVHMRKWEAVRRRLSETYYSKPLEVSFESSRTKVAWLSALR